MMEMNINVNANTKAWEVMSEDDLLMQWNIAKQQVEYAKAYEMELRKHIVSRAFPVKHEGTNTKELGQGYQLKAGVKFNYSLDSDNKKVEQALDNIAKIGNQGAFIAERLVSWKPNFLLTEYRALCDEAKEGSESAKAILSEIHAVLTITEAAPTLEIREPRGKK